MSQKKTWRAEAPSNIALIKYMGKTDATKNLPTNSSLSYTLSHLRSVVTLESVAGEDRWEPLLEDRENKDLQAISLSEKGQVKFLKHLDRVRDFYGYRGRFLVRSANDFPADCGLASSASSFAALTKAAVQAMADLTGKSMLNVEDSAKLSRQGSGSSCRSFFSPWVLWSRTDEVRRVSEIEEGDLIHQVVVVDDQKKSVSSSEAHLRVLTSSLFAGRAERAEQRVDALIRALAQNDWREAFEISWAEFWDMHVLFETSSPSFGYMSSGSLDVLRSVRQLTWDRGMNGPLVTMDAGPNVHLLFRNDASGREAAQRVREELSRSYRIFASSDVRGGIS